MQDPHREKGEDRIASIKRAVYARCVVVLPRKRPLSVAIQKTPIRRGVWTGRVGVLSCPSKSTARGGVGCSARVGGRRATSKSLIVGREGLSRRRGEILYENASRYIALAGRRHFRGRQRYCQVGLRRQGCGVPTFARIVRHHGLQSRRVLIHLQVSSPLLRLHLLLA